MQCNSTKMLDLPLLTEQTYILASLINNSLNQMYYIVPTHICFVIGRKEERKLFYIVLCSFPLRCCFLIARFTYYNPLKENRADLVSVRAVFNHPRLERREVILSLVFSRFLFLFIGWGGKPPLCR